VTILGTFIDLQKDGKGTEHLQIKKPNQYPEIRSEQLQSTHIVCQYVFVLAIVGGIPIV
jgi:hypothetical protein